jgi:hypothetical protein
MKEMVMCGFCWLATMVTCIVFAALTLVSTSQITNLQKVFDGNSSTIFKNFNTSLYNSVAGLEVVGSVFGAVDRFNNDTFGGFLDLLGGDVQIAVAERVDVPNVPSFQERLRSEVSCSHALAYFFLPTADRTRISFKRFAVVWSLARSSAMGR